MNDEPIVYAPPTKDSIILELQAENRALRGSVAHYQAQAARFSTSNRELIPLTDGVTVGMLLEVVNSLPNIPQKTELKRLLVSLPAYEKKAHSHE